MKLRRKCFAPTWRIKISHVGKRQISTWLSYFVVSDASPDSFQHLKIEISGVESWGVFLLFEFIRTFERISFGLSL